MTVGSGGPLPVSAAVVAPTPAFSVVPVAPLLPLLTGISVAPLAPLAPPFAAVEVRAALNVTVLLALGVRLKLVILIIEFMPVSGKIELG